MSYKFCGWKKHLYKSEAKSSFFQNKTKQKHQPKKQKTLTRSVQFTELSYMAAEY